jgi:L-threonylcarbamoyladenylate synthase
MKTLVIPINPAAPQAGVIDRAAAVLRGGGLVAFPTETVYGLGANALDPDAVGRIFAAKGRPATNPVIVHVADAAGATTVAASWPDAAARLAERFWPGPLTLVLPRRPEVPDAVTAAGPTVAVRVPAHPVARALIRTAAVPVAAPSANRSTRVSPTRAEHVLAGLEGRIDLILDGGPTPGGLESTVLDLATPPPPRLLRPGLVSPSEIEEVVGPILRPGEVRGDESEPLRSPGMLPRHYAPRAVLECPAGDGLERVEELCRQGLRVGWLTWREDIDDRAGLTRVVMPRAPQRYAAQLYAVLHALDAAGVERIVAELPPETEEWLAVRDRLRRAAVRP